MLIAQLLDFKVQVEKYEKKEERSPDEAEKKKDDGYAKALFEKKLFDF